MPASVHDVKLIEQLGPPFARALAEFVRALSAPDEHLATPNGRSHANHSVPSDGDFVVEEITAVPDPSSPVSAKDIVEFNPAVPAKRYGNRLRQIFRERGLKQADIARKLKVAPSVISRVFKHPERSRLATIRRIANAAGVSLSDLI